MSDKPMELKKTYVRCKLCDNIWEKPPTTEFETMKCPECGHSGPGAFEMFRRKVENKITADAVIPFKQYFTR